MTSKVVLATSNRGKLAEFQDLLGEWGFLLEQAERDSLEGIEETGLSFLENALIKARAVAKYSQAPTLADDSGLVVPSLNGQPGIYSARFAGVPSNDQANNQKLLKELDGQVDRTARFVCVLVYLQNASDPEPTIAAGQWQGVINQTPRGSNGFGYDPLFYIPELGQTAAELDAIQKNRLSHRARAIQSLLPLLEQRLSSLD